MGDKEIMIEFAEKIGKLTTGLKDLKKNFDNHIKQHKTDRIMQWVIIALQTIVIIFLGWLMASGKI